MGERITYFYVVNDREELVGVLPTRRLLTSPQEEMVGNIMVERVLTIPETATALEACEAFVLHKFLAFPIVDYRRRLVGMVDVGLLNEEVFDVAEKQRDDELFEAMEADFTCFVSGMTAGTLPPTSWLAITRRKKALRRHAVLRPFSTASVFISE